MPRPLPRRTDTGSVAVELTLLAPLLVVLLLFVVAAGRVTSARIAVQDAAQAAARAATLAPDAGILGPAGADDRARTAASRATADLPCRQLSVALADPRTARRDAPAGTAGIRLVSARVTCTVDLGGLTGLGLPGSTDISVTATSPLDRYRSVPREFANSEGLAGANRSRGSAA